MSEAKKLHVVKPGADTAGRVDELHVVLLGLSAAIVSVADERPRVLAVQRPDSADALPFGTFDPIAHRTLEFGIARLGPRADRIAARLRGAALHVW